MPGLIGVARKQSARSPSTEPSPPSGSHPLDGAVLEMRRLLSHLDFYETTEAAGTNDVRGAAALVPPVESAATHTHHGKRFIGWLNGEVSEAEGAGPISIPTLAEWVSEGRHDALADLDGIFAAAIYDRKHHELHLLTDRYGFKYLYWWEDDGQVVWSSETKGFLEAPGFEPSIDRESLAFFMEHGRHDADRSWFSGVQLVPPGSVLTWDLSGDESRETQYWSWDHVSIVQGIGQAEAAERMGELWERAVRRQAERDPDQRLGVGLSGGLDSRAILAALNEPDLRNCRTFTFGRGDCRDLRIARQVAKRFDLDHDWFRIDETNWFEGRLQGIWMTDGHVPLRHLHSMAALPSLPGRIDVNLNGFLGGALQSGKYIKAGDEATLEDKLASRGRRLINQGMRLFEAFVPNRRPFFDRDLVDFTLSLPRELLAGGRVYHQMLLDCYPRFFETIPWDHTGTTIDTPRWMLDPIKWMRDLQRAVSTINPFAPAPTQRMYVDYARWLGGPTYGDILEDILLSDDALYRDYLPDLPVRKIWQKVRARTGGGLWKQVVRLLTFEIWLQQVFERRWRSDASF